MPNEGHFVKPLKRTRGLIPTTIAKKPQRTMKTPSSRIGAVHELPYVSFEGGAFHMAFIFEQGTLATAGKDAGPARS